MTIYNTTADTTLITADTTLFTADIDPYALPAPVTKAVDDYMALITPWQANSVKARFLATVRAGVQPYADGQVVIASLPQAFDLDEAVGTQLDVDGQWIGRSRFIPTPAPNTLFSFDTDNLGFDQGYIDGPYDSSQGLSSLPDNLYRKLLKAKVLANAWDGTTTGAIGILNTYFDDAATKVFIQDSANAIPFGPDNPPLFSFDINGHGFDESYVSDPFLYPAMPDVAPMSYAVCVAGKIPSIIDLYLLGSDLLPVRSMGVDIEYAITTVDGAPLFGFDMDDDQVAGFDVGAIDADPFAVAALIS